MTNCHHLLLAYTPYFKLSLFITMNLHAVTTLTFVKYWSCGGFKGSVLTHTHTHTITQAHLYKSAMSIQATEFKVNTQFYPQGLVMGNAWLVWS